MEQRKGIAVPCVSSSHNQPACPTGRAESHAHPRLLKKGCYKNNADTDGMPALKGMQSHSVGCVIYSDEVLVVEVLVEVLVVEVLVVEVLVVIVLVD